jgi:DNA repair photolyase
MTDSSSFAEKHRFSVHITVTTLDDRLAPLLEPKAPPPRFSFPDGRTT